MPCPDSAVCAKGSPVTTTEGSFLLRVGGALVVYDCPAGFGISGSTCQDQLPPAAGAWLNSTVTAYSCCAPDRRPAIDASGAINLLCATCRDGLSQAPAARTRS